MPINNDLPMNINGREFEGLSSQETLWRAVKTDDKLKATPQSEVMVLYDASKIISKGDWLKFYNDSKFDRAGWNAFCLQYGCKVDFDKANANGGETLDEFEFLKAMGVNEKIGGTSRDEFNKRFNAEGSNFSPASLNLLYTDRNTVRSDEEIDALATRYANEILQGRAGLNYAQYQQAVSLNNPALADRNNTFGRQKDGVITREELIATLKEIIIADSNIAARNETNRELRRVTGGGFVDPRNTDVRTTTAKTEINDGDGDSDKSKNVSNDSTTSGRVKVRPTKEENNFSKLLEALAASRFGDIRGLYNAVLEIYPDMQTQSYAWQAARMTELASSSGIMVPGMFGYFLGWVSVNIPHEDDPA